MKRLEACHRYQDCSVNNCPLEDTKHYICDSDPEQSCPLSVSEVKKIKEQYEHLQNDVSPNVFTKYTGIDVTLKGEPLRKMKSLNKSCCNYENGKCKVLESRCVQSSLSNLECAWFVEAVIPLSPELEREIESLKISGKSIERKQCAECGKSFAPKNNKQKYCVKCIPKVTKKQNLLRQQKRRLVSRNRSSL